MSDVSSKLKVSELDFDNIKSNLTLISPKKWLIKHPGHRGAAAVISAGPYLDYKKLL